MNIQDPSTKYGVQVPKQLQLQDRLLTPLEEDGCRLVFFVTEIYPDGTYGGNLVRADDPHAVCVEYYEELTPRQIADNGWYLLDGPSASPTTAH